MRMPFGRRKKTAAPMAATDEAAPMEAGEETAEEREAASSLPGVAGYYGTGRKKDNMPGARFEFRRPDGKPVPHKHAERRRGGFFS